MSKINIGGNEYDFKLTLESWKALRKVAGITPSNIQEKINEDMAGVISALVFYGLTPEDRKIMPQDFIDKSIDLSIAKQIVSIVEAGLSPERKDDGPKN